MIWIGHLLPSSRIRESNLKICHDAAIDRLRILTGNDLICYFRSVANRHNMQIHLSESGKIHTIQRQWLLQVCCKGQLYIGHSV